MQPTELEMMVKSQQRELSRKRQQSHHSHNLKPSRKPRLRALARFLKQAE